MNSFLFLCFLFSSWNPVKAGSICDPSLSGKYHIHDSACKNCVLINQASQPDPCGATCVLFSLYIVCLFVDSVILIEAMYIYIHDCLLKQMLCIYQNKRTSYQKIKGIITMEIDQHRSPTVIFSLSRKKGFCL